MDDDIALLEALSQTLRLRMSGLAVDTSDSALAALERVAMTDYDAIVSDIKMPGMDGLALLAEIRVRQPSTPTLLITGHGESLTLQALRGGAYDFIQKPINREYFIATLKRAIELRRLNRRVAEQQEALEQHAGNLERIVEERTRELREAHRLKDEFLAMLSHELRTPLTSVLGWSNLMRTANLDSVSSAKALEIIERNARSLSRLIEDLLDVSRIISGKLALDIAPVDLSTIVNTAVESVRPAAVAKDIRLQVTLCSPSTVILGDGTRLQQILLNLVSNAIKFTRKGGSVSVSLDDTGSEARIEVSDNGKGISAEFLPHVFDRFRQADASPRRLHGGLGIGLAVVRHLVEIHGGTVHAESRGEGTGATFTVTLPVVVPEEEARQLFCLKHSKNDSFPVDSGSLEGLRILIVEDQPDTRELLSLILSRFGAEVMSVGSSKEAIETLLHWRPDVLLSDIALPEEDGFALIRRVRALGTERGGNIPAVAITGYAGSEVRDRALLEGYQTHIAKPVDPDHLVQILASLVKGAPLSPDASNLFA